MLVVGGRGAGKRAFVMRQLGLGAGQLSASLEDDAPVVYDVAELVRHTPRGQLLEPLCAKQAVICDEVGCGVVPLAAEERRWREEVGRLCCELAERADVVVRVSCGLPQVLKGRLC